MSNMKSIHLREIGLVKILTKEIPIVMVFIYIAYLSWWFHERDHRMMDYALNFDHWWYFYHRLHEGALAQWNPFSLFGRIAVQYNYIPISVLFSPLFVLLEPTLKLYNNFQIVSTFLGILIIYMFGRMLGYGRYYSLVPLSLILVASSYKYWISFVYFAAFFFFYPLSIVVFIKAVEKNVYSIRQWILFIILFSFSLLGLRLEKMIYAAAFVLVMIFSILITSWRDWQKMRQFFLAGTSALIIVLVLIGWQFPFLLVSALNTDRVNIAFKLSNVVDIELWRWIFLSIILQKFLLLTLLNLGIVAVIKYLRKSNYIFNIRTAFIVIAVEILAVNSLHQYLYNLNSHLFPHFGALLMDLHMLNEKRVDILFSYHGIIALLLCLALFFVRENSATGVRFFSLLSAMFAAFYIAEYSWQYWAIGNNVFTYFWPPVIASFIVLGAISLWYKKKYWMLITLVIFHFIAETISVFLYDVFGYPWLPGRASLAEIPFQVLLLLESLVYFTDGILYIFKKLFFKVNVSRDIKLLINPIIYVIVFMSIKTILIPGQEIIIDEKQAYKASELFPFSETVLYPFESNKGKNQWLKDAFQNADKAKEAGKQNNPWKRVYVSDNVHSWGPMYFKFLPAYSQTINTAPVYASEIPKIMRDIFRHDDKQVINLHYEVNPMVLAYFAYKWKESVGEMSTRHLDFGTMTLLLPHAINDKPLYKELMAEEGSNTPRAFLSTKVVKLNRQVEEYGYLKDVLAKGGSVMHQITTSDKNFGLATSQSILPLKYTLEFERDDPEHIVFQVDTNRNAYLALLDLYSPGWRAFTYEKETKIYRGYMGTRFVSVPEGQHKVEFKYQVPYLIPAMGVSAAGWIIILIILLGNFLVTEVARGSALPPI